MKKVLVDKLLMATGRGPNTASSVWRSLGVATGRGFIKVNPFMETNVKGIYAIGDVVPTPLLAHVAFQEGIVAVEKIAGHNPTPINYLQVPNCTYCDPQIASVGLTEAKAVAAGYKVKIGKFPFMAVGKARIEDATDGFVKIVADEKYGEILGVHMIGEGVTEIFTKRLPQWVWKEPLRISSMRFMRIPRWPKECMKRWKSVFGAAIHI